MAKRRLKTKAKKASQKARRPKAGAKKRSSPKKRVEAKPKKAPVLKKTVKSGAAKGRMSKRRINPGDIPFEKLIFTNKRYFDNATVSAVNGNNVSYGPTEPISFPGQTPFPWPAPPDWLNIMSVTVFIYGPSSYLGNCVANVPVSLPQVYPSYGTFELDVYVDPDTYDATLVLFDADGNPLVTGKSVIQAS